MMDSFKVDFHANMQYASTDSEKKKAIIETILENLFPSLINAVIAAMVAVLPQFLYEVMFKAIRIIWS